VKYNFSSPLINDQISQSVLHTIPYKSYSSFCNLSSTKGENFPAKIMQLCAQNYLKPLGIMSRLITIKKSTFYAPCLSQSLTRFSPNTKQLKPIQTKVLTSARHSSNRPWQVQNRRQNWGSNNPIFNGDNLLYSIIGLNVIVFGAWKYSENDRKSRRFLQDNFTISSNGVTRELRIHTFLTSIFSHRDPWHLLSNSVAFYFFGQTCLSYLGSPRFLVLYIGGGLVTSCAQVLGPYIIPRDFPSRFKVSKYSSAAGE
jgi:Rhomboid family